ncbi:MAG: ABC transporter ATP-binding protein [Thermoanaerobacterales bacterium]|nr:ABC transporter ATP-binding protein [Bacillota bacterium]MDI6906338.1 ABC transporter ATP-binding protein [Thermoanaerobacterales bacterium]
MLAVTRLTKRFGGLLAVNDVSFEVRSGEVLALIGPNGAGKTTTFNLITGVVQPDEGDIVFQNRRLNGLKPFRIAELGITRTFQNLELFTTLTVVENVMVGSYRMRQAGFLRSVFRRPGVMAEDRSLYETASALLDRLGLAGKAHLPAGELTFGQQRLLEIARALASSPKVLLLDEPAAGLNEAESRELSRFLLSLADSGLALVLVEHDMETVMETADRVVVLNFGAVIAVGTPDEIQRNPEVIAAYLGKEEEEDC